MVFRKLIPQSVRPLSTTKSLKSRYSSEYPWVFDIIEPGYNYRLDEIRSSLGITQLKRIKKINELRKKASLYYHKNLQNIPGIAGHLMAASIMSAPAALVIAKIMYPESEKINNDEDSTKL